MKPAKKPACKPAPIAEPKTKAQAKALITKADAMYRKAGVRQT